MPEQPGLDQLQKRMQRASRTVPPPRRPADPDTPAGLSDAATPEPAPPEVTSQETTSLLPPAAPAPADAGPSPVPPSPAPLGPEIQANLAVRVRRSLDWRLDDLVRELRRTGNRSSKAELIELLLWELPPTVTGELSARLALFRDATGGR